MFKDMKRARRRHDRARMVAKAARLRPWAAFPQKGADNLASCSCWMCGNPRRHWLEPTMQERRADQAAQADD
ncbi:hypothetical protein TSH58_04505 [Azospirillum sp. TSH58]|nr:hypothetical protein TSH58_04505 [Azospirillum sp. TSH58]